MNKLVMSFAAVLAVTASACVVVVDDDGLHSGSAWSDWRNAQYRGSGTSATQAREVADFHQVSMRCSADARIQVGGTKSVSATCDDNLIERLVTRVENDVLIVEMQPGSYNFRVHPRVEISVPALEGLRISGSSDVTLDGLNGGAFSIGVSGSGDVVAHGSVDSLAASVSGSGDLHLYDLAAKRVTITISGSGDVQVSPSEALTTQISGSGDVRYRGSPSEVTSSLSGSGSVRHD